MFEKRVVIGKKYCIFAPDPVTVTADMNNTKVTLVNAIECGKYFFTAPTTKIYSSVNPGCIFEPDNTLNYNSGNTPSWLYSLKVSLQILLGETAVKLNLTENKLVVHTDRADDTQLEAVTALLERTLPQNINIERYNHRIDVDWRDYPLPRNYTAIEWIEGKARSKIHTDFYPSSNTEVHFDFVHLSEIYWQTYGFLFGNESANDAFSLALYDGSAISFDFGGQRLKLPNSSPTSDERHYLKINRHELLIDDVLIGEPHEVNEFKSTKKMNILGGHYQIYEGKFLDEGVLHCHFMPALDETGAPCLFDIVGRKAYYNVSEGDFLYPTESTTYALRRTLPDWGKLTPHGLRRLYHAPANYTGELIDYALANGFKPIVETEQPAEGYWSPHWTETAEEIVLEWVETEPPAEHYGLPAELTEQEE